MDKIFEIIKTFNKDFVEFFDPIEESNIIEFENEIGMKLPVEFIEFLKFSNGITIDGDEILGLSNQKYDLKRAYNIEHFEVKFPMFDYIIPFSPDGRGNFYCFDKNNNDNIVFWVSNYNYTANDNPEIVYSTFKDWFQEVMIDWTIENNDEELFKKEELDKKQDDETLKSSVYKTYQGKDYTKEEWKVFEEEEYRKYVEKRSGKKSSFLADDKIEKQNFSAESGRLTEVKYFVMNSKNDKVPVYEYPSTMAAPFTFLNNGTAIEVLKYEQNGWCEILSKEKKKAYIQSNHVKKND